jgi:hypothetical protein
MNTPSSSPAVSAAPPSAKGLSQVTDGVTASSELVPPTTRPMATPAKTSSESTCSRISAFWNRAETSVPITHTAAITAITTTVRATTTGVVSARSSSPTVSSPNRTAVSAREPTTRTPVIAIAQPPIQPSHGPIARVTHEKVVPQSWSALFK